MNSALTISELNHAVAGLLERSFPLVQVHAEISNFSRASSGHWYFTLKDDSAQVRCAMFKGRSQWADFTPRDGDQVLVSAQVRLYEARGDYQLVVDAMKRAGVGGLLEAFERLKQKLAQQGLFEAARKRALPLFPRCVGIVTSAEAAALQDVLTTLRSRAPHVRLLLYPTPVQGEGAAQKIAQALQCANAHGQADVLILCRGGGSMEDLWAFNDEALAQVIASSAIPVVSGVGHETDVTIADWVADVRAPTPTAAAQLVARPRDEWLNTLAYLEQALRQALRRNLEQATLRIDRLPERLQQALRRHLEQKQQRLHHAQELLSALSPQATLKRGYVMARNAQGLVTSAHSVKAGEILELQFHDGLVLTQTQSKAQSKNS